MDGVPLAEAVAVLRRELVEAVVAGDGSPVRFGVRELELNLEVAVTRVADGHAGIKFWLLDVGGKAEVSDAVTHRVTLKLDPVGPDGKPIRLADASAVKPD